MIEFKPLELSDNIVFQKYLSEYKFNTYEYSFLNLYLWRKYCNVQYAVLNDVLIIKKSEGNAGTYFMQPIGFKDENLKDIISMLYEIKKDYKDMLFLLGDIEEPFLKKLLEIYGEKLIYIEDVKKFDYIYEAKKLINFTGEKLRKRKLQYNQFKNSYNFEIKDIHDKKVIEDCIYFSEKWFDAQNNKDEQIMFELEGIKDILTNFQFLNAIGMAVYINNNIAGFTIGEKVNKKMAVIHIEKGDVAYKGIYAFINRIFAKIYLSDIVYINREEDVGIEGIRRAKLAYDPIKLEKKYLINIQ